VTCWGDPPEHYQDPDLPGTYTQIAAGGSQNDGTLFPFLCGLTTGRKVECSGGEASLDFNPPGDFSQVSVGGALACVCGLAAPSPAGVTARWVRTWLLQPASTRLASVVEQVPTLPTSAVQ
jgi:hypothetical protein